MVASMTLNISSAHLSIKCSISDNLFQQTKVRASVNLIKIYLRKIGSQLHCSDTMTVVLHLQLQREL